MGTSKGEPWPFGEGDPDLEVVEHPGMEAIEVLGNVGDRGYWSGGDRDRGMRI